MTSQRKTLALALLFACVATALPASGRSRAREGRCLQCEPSNKFRASLGIPVPDNAIIYDFGNGPFWRNSYLLVIDLDQARALTYRNPPDEPEPTKLQLAGTEKLSAQDVEALEKMAEVAWNPPREEMPSIRSDTFQTLYVLRSGTMVRNLEMGEGPAWFKQLLDKMEVVGRPSEHRLDRAKGLMR